MSRAFSSISLCIVAVIAFAGCPGAYSSIERGLTSHFSSWLQANDYGSYDFEREDLEGGSYGGKDSAGDKVAHTPIVFLHGNSDIAVGVGKPKSWQTGFTTSIEYFLSKGYTKSEMYATTWGDGNPDHAQDRVHDFKTLNRLRKFIEAVLSYTGASEVNIISHSMGVTLGRKIAKGGETIDGGDLGPSIKGSISTFIGLAGANWGLAPCFDAPSPVFPTCGTRLGFYPGYAFGPLGLSEYLHQINTSGGAEADYVFAIFSLFDDLILFGDVVWGQYTSAIPGQNDQLVLKEPKYTHIGTRDLTVSWQYAAITKHSLSIDQDFLALME